MPKDYLTKKMFTWDYDLCQNWYSKVEKKYFVLLIWNRYIITKTVCNLDFMKTECKKIDESQ